MAYSAITANTKLGFKAGIQEDLNQYLKGSGKPNSGKLTEGVFYLTTDTQRLYIGRKDEEDGGIYPVPVNQGILPIASFNDLNAITTAETGEFYYIKDSNILCIRSGDKWVQINPDTNNINESLTIGVSMATDDDTGVSTATITTSVEDDKDNEVSGTFDYKTGEGIAFETEEGIDNSLTIIGSTYDIGVTKDPTAPDNDYSEAIIQLTPTGADSGNGTTVTLTAGDYIALTPDTSDNSIEIKSTFGFSEGELTLITTDGNDKGKITLQLTDNDDQDLFEDPIMLNEAIYYTLGEDTKKYYPQDSLPVYTQSEIDTKIAQLNAMVYRGTVGDEGTIASLPTKEVQYGDTYLVVSEITYDGTNTAKKGDLLIATGTEAAEGDNVGYLETIVWTFVPSGDEAAKDTTYKFVHDKTNNTITLTDSNSQDRGTIQINGASGSPITVSMATSEGTDPDITGIYTINHTESNRKDSTNTASSNAESVTAITGVTSDKYGHVTGVTTQTYNLMAYNIKDNDITVTTADNVSTASLKTTLLGSDDAIKSSSIFDIKSSTLNLTATNSSGSGDSKVNTSLSLDLVWGTF